jgi:hypothetical protein
VCNIKEAVVTMSTELNIVPGCMSKSVKRRIRCEVKLPSAFQNEIDGQDWDSSCHQFWHPINGKQMDRKVERHGKRAHGLHSLYFFQGNLPSGVSVKLVTMHHEQMLVN